MEIQQVYVEITQEDDSVAIMGFLTRGRGSSLPYGAVWSDAENGWWLREANDENVFAEIARAFPKAKSFKQIDPSAIPEDRTFRDALRFDGNRFIHDMTKAREIKRDHLRHARAPLFEQNDLALRDATLDNDRPKIETAKRRRDYLRNVTKDPRIEAARTTEELKEIEIE